MVDEWCTDKKMVGWVDQWSDVWMDRWWMNGVQIKRRWGG